jgi:hypothetical protein
MSSARTRPPGGPARRVPRGRRDGSGRQLHLEFDGNSAPLHAPPILTTPSGTSVYDKELGTRGRVGPVRSRVLGDLVARARSQSDTSAVLQICDQLAF